MTTTHSLGFFCRPWHRDPEWTDFQVGTCHGLYKATKGAYEILAINNDSPGNGHFQDVMQWFEASCRRDRKSLIFLEIMNARFKKHLLEDRGFKPYRKEDAIKHFHS